MPGSFALIDLVTPHVLGAAAIGEPLHELISALFVQDVETTFDDAGVVLAGVARFSADLTANPPRFTPPASISFGGSVAVDHRTARHSGAWWDFPDIAITFRLSAPRASSPAVDAVTGTPGGGGALTSNPAASGVLPRLGQGVPAVGQPAQDAPSTVFHLDLLVDAATLHLPYLTGALLQPDGALAPDPAHPEVTVTLPKIKLSFEQTAGTATTDPQLTIALDSWAAHDIDDPAGTASAELLRMNPPYALIGPGDTLGFGFQSLILDLSGTETPPELLAKVGVGDDFRGLYLPDVRVFVKPPGLDGVAVDVSARELVIGIGPEGGISGIFGLDIVKPDAPQSVTVSVYDANGAFLTRIEFPDAPGPGAPTPFTADPIDVPASTQWVVDVHGGQPPYHVTVDGQVQTTAPVIVTFPAGEQSRTVEIDVADVHAGGSTRTGTVPIRLTATSLTAGQTAPGGAQPATLTVTTAPGPGYAITTEDNPAGESVTLVFTPADPTGVTLDGAPAMPSGGRLTVPLKHGAAFDASATWETPAVVAPPALPAYFGYADPPQTANQVPDPDDPAWAQFAGDPTNPKANIRNGASVDNGGTPGWTPGAVALQDTPEFDAFRAAAQAHAGATIMLVGKASKEHDPNVDYNDRLSWRRVYAMTAFLNAYGVTNHVDGHGVGEQPPPPDPDSGYFRPGRGAYRRVECTLVGVGVPASTHAGAVHVARPPRPQLPVPTTPTVVPRQPAGDDDVRFKELHVRVQIDHNRPIAVEVTLKIDVQTVLEKKLATASANNPGQGQPGGAPTVPVGTPADPNDGVLDMRVQVTLDDTAERWQVVASLFEQDKDGLLQTPPPSATGPDSDAAKYWRTFAGVLIAMAPLTDALAASDTVAGDVVALTASFGAAFFAAQFDLVQVPYIRLYGGELTVTHDTSGTKGVLLLDVEVALVVNLTVGGVQIITTQPQNPITVRYKGVGFGTSDKPQLQDLTPVFDSSKGFAVNIPSTGSITVPPPLGDILQVAGARIARSNPANLELDLELKADLGVVSVDKTTVRIPLEGGQLPTISALGVHIDVPGAIDGHGYLAILPDGFAGQLDVSLTGLGIRVSAGLAVRHVTDPDDAAHTATAVLVTLEVDFPVPIALGSSGLGIYGFGGLFAMHFARDENPTAAVPALDWLTRVHGNPLDVTGWKPDIDHWAIGLGAVLGTMDAGFTLNVKGMLIFELPGPRILLVMKANLIQPRPGREGDVTATILAIIDLDLGRQRITIGLTFDYDIDPLLKIHVPIRAVFPFQDLAHFAIDAGSWYAPATVEFFQIFTAKGYFMIRGKGIPDSGAPADNYDAGQGNFPLPTPLTGFSIMTGVTVSYLWGSRSSGLYLSVGSSIDVGIGFAPVIFSGHLKLWGELHLWVVGVEASAELTVIAGRRGGDSIVLIDGEVHGKVDLFFFSIEGSVHVTLGGNPDSPDAPPPLVTGVSLHSRAAALLSGVSSDRPIDGKLVDAHADGPAPANEAVPIDAILVVHLDCAPQDPGGANPAVAISTTGPGGAAVSTPVTMLDGGPQRAVRRGEQFYTYRLTGITLDNGVTAGALPAVWWRNEPAPGPESKRDLAILTRVPDPHPSAVERSSHLTDKVTETWGSTCDPVAPPAAVLWTFHDAPLGPSPTGWVLTGTAWPDDPGTVRSAPVDLRLDVAETWRTGNPVLDLSVDIAPARVVGGGVECDQDCVPRVPVRRLPTVPGRELLTLAATQDATAADRLARFAVRSCWAHLLEAPFRRAHDPELIKAHPLGDVLLDMAAEAAARRQDDLDDVVALRTGPIAGLTALLAVPTLLLESKRLTVRFFAADGTLLDDRAVVVGNGEVTLVNSPDDLPGSWTKTGRPWHCRVGEVWRWLVGNVRKQGLRPVLLTPKVPPGTAFVQFGIRGLDDLLARGLARPSYLVGVVETLSAAEVARSQYDTLLKDTTINVIDGALADGAPQALLLPDRDYAVAVSWEWAACDANGAVSGGWTPGSATYHFRTDNQPLAPAAVQVGDQPAQVMPVRLDPWVLLTEPDGGEHFFFYGDHVRFVFTVDYLLTMFETYGDALQARVRAASLKNSAPTDPNVGKTIAALNPAILQLLPGVSVFTPWEGTARGVLDGQPCVDVSNTVSRQRLVDLDLLLEPRTDYVLDLEPVNAPAPPPGGSIAPLFRRPFTTSRYRDWTELAADTGAAQFVETPAEAAAVAGLVALVGAPAPLSGAAVDAALRQAGLRPVVDVGNPLVEVLWVSDGAALQPRVLVVRTPEPLVRTRRQPLPSTPPGGPRLQREVVTLQDQPYLDVVPTGAAGGAVLHVVGRPGTNTLIVVVDGGRGRPIDLSLRRYGNPFLGEAGGFVDQPLFDLTLAAATWEVV